MPPTNRGSYYELTNGAWGVQYHCSRRHAQTPLAVPEHHCSWRWHAKNVLAAMSISHRLTTYG